MGRKKTVMITDDDPGIQDTFSLIFQRAGYETYVTDSGDPLLEGTAPIPDIYVLDKQLSGVDGLDVCRHLKSQPETSHVPVLMVSATPLMAAMAKEVCADAFLEKPFDQDELLAIVHRLLKATPAEM